VARLADRSLAEELFAERPRNHQLQTLASRQGETLEDLVHVRARVAELERRHDGAPVPCPSDWGAVLVVPETVEFWSEADDRLHDRQLYRRAAEGWIHERLAP
jgi:pyridoxamine 5'-phosphate oxidase